MGYVCPQQAAPACLEHCTLQWLSQAYHLFMRLSLLSLQTCICHMCLQLFAWNPNVETNLAGHGISVVKDIHVQSLNLGTCLFCSL